MPEVGLGRESFTDASDCPWIVHSGVLNTLITCQTCPMAHFAVTYSYSAPEGRLDEVRPEHRTYLRRLTELVLSGPWGSGESGALLIFNASDLAAVEALVAADPIVTSGCVAQRTIREWKPANGRLADHL